MFLTTNKPITKCFVFVLCAAFCPLLVHGEKHTVDAKRSTMRVHVGTSGVFGAFGDKHEIAAPISEGEVDTGANPSVRLKVPAAKLRVLDPNLAADKRTEVQKTMEGPKVLDVSRYPEIRFESSAVQKGGKEGWTVRGNLHLHGQTRPITVSVAPGKEGCYQGSAKFKQRQFGITPVSVAGGTVKVKDEVKIEFNICTAK